MDVDLENSPSQKLIYEALLVSPADINTLQLRTGLSKKAIYNAISKMKDKGIAIIYDNKGRVYVLEPDMDLISVLEKEKEKRVNRVMQYETNRALKHLSFYDLISDILSNTVEKINFDNIDKPPKPDKHKGNQSGVALFSDIHIGRWNDVYNMDVALKLLDNHVDSILDVSNIESKGYVMNGLNIFALGDFVDGESIFPGHAFKVEVPVVEQAIKLGKAFAEKIAYMSQYYPEINVYCVYGNHGRNGKYSAKLTNWDFVLYKFAEVALGNSPNIHFYYPKGDRRFLTAQVEEHGFLLMHGDRIRMHYQIPYYGISNKSMKWAQSIANWEYLTMGHFHHYDLGQKIVTKEVIMNGAYLMGDDYSLEEIGVENIEPTQVFMGVHKKRGVTWRYPIYLK